jgi:ATP-dependent RNA helicase RhlE
MLQDPVYIEVTPSHTAAESVVQKVYLVSRSNKRALLLHLITTGKWSQILVFTRTRHGANKLTEKLAASGISAAAMHGNKSQSFRTRALQAFKNGETRILVATDVAARGLDISNLPYVVNYDMPGSPEDYVHRIGRTGRAGISGIAVSLVSHDEKPHLQTIEKLLKRKIPVEKVDGYTEDSDVPDYVLFRPDSASNQKKADSAIKEMVARRTASKKQSQTRKPKTSGSGKNPGKESRSRSGGRSDQAGKKPPRSGPRRTQSSKPGKPGGRR